eukprot:1159874-Pelagomonas_calceolata.AAC.7
MSATMWGLHATQGHNTGPQNLACRQQRGRKSMQTNLGHLLQALIGCTPWTKIKIVLLGKKWSHTSDKGQTRSLFKKRMPMLKAFQAA